MLTLAPDHRSEVTRCSCGVIMDRDDNDAGGIWIEDIFGFVRLEPYREYEVVMKIEYTVQIWKEGNQYIAHAMPLDVMSSGKTPQISREALQEAVSLFVRTAREMGTLEEVLEESGYERQAGDWVSPAWISVERQSLDMVV